MTASERSIVLAAIRREVANMRHRWRAFYNAGEIRSVEAMQHEIDVLKDWAARLKKERVVKL